MYIIYNSIFSTFLFHILQKEKFQFKKLLIFVSQPASSRSDRGSAPPAQRVDSPPPLVKRLTDFGSKDSGPKPTSVSFEEFTVSQINLSRFFVVEMKVDMNLSLFEEVVLLFIYYVSACLLSSF